MYVCVYVCVMYACMCVYECVSMFVHVRVRARRVDGDGDRRDGGMEGAKFPHVML